MQLLKEMCRVVHGDSLAFMGISKFIKGESWELLKLLSNQNNLPWLCCEDFNEIVRGSEKIGGSPLPEWQMRQFRDALAKAGLSSLPSRGPHYTWKGRRHGVGWIKA
jgi:hypothetical protein